MVDPMFKASETIARNVTSPSVAQTNVGPVEGRDLSHLEVRTEFIRAIGAVAKDLQATGNSEQGKRLQALQSAVLDKKILLTMSSSLDDIEAGLVFALDRNPKGKV